MSITRIAYWAMLWLWLPLAAIAARRPTMWRRLSIPIAFSLMGLAYEAFMTFVWEPKVIAPIRIDILGVLVVLGMIDALAAVALAATSRGHPRRKAVLAASALCAVVPVLVVASLDEMERDTTASVKTMYSGLRLRFEAAFRDDATERRFFGDLRPDRNPFAGYYRGGDADDRYAHLVINDGGRFWLYTKDLFESKGAGRVAEDGASFVGQGDRGIHERMRITLAPASAGTSSLTVDHGYSNAAPVTAPMRKAAPPRFPVPPPSSRDEVRFDGVYSAVYDERPGDFWLTQVWLWSSGDRWWGEYIRDNYPRGYEKAFISATHVAAKCEAGCGVLEFETGRGKARLTREGPDAWIARMDGVPQPVTLHRGETLPGLPYDLAPTATRAEHEGWMKAVKQGYMVSWTPPARPP